MLALQGLPWMAMVAPCVLVTDGLAPAALSKLSEGGCSVVEQHFTPDELLAGALADYDAVIIRSATTLEADAIALGCAGRLRVIGRAGVGVDNIAVQAASTADCWVLNTPGASTASVVELTLAHLLAAARGLQLADYGLKSGLWLKGKIRMGDAGGPRLGHELAGKRLGLLGFGRAAQGVARAASALGMSVSTTSRQPDAAIASAIGVEIEPTPAHLVAACTHVAVLCALTPETRGLVDKLMLSRMPHIGADGTPCGAHLVNMARGGIVIEEDAAVALNDGTLTTYATDVFEVEPPVPTNPLLRCEAFCGTPHIGGATHEAQARVGLQIVDVVLAVLNGRAPADGVVSAPAGFRGQAVTRESTS